MQYEECLNFLFEQLPIFHKQGKAAFNKDLAKTIALCELIGNPHHDLKFIHVAGTNGKGSVCHVLASVWKEAGHTTGLYTSPHLFDFRERIRVNGNFIEKDFVVRFTEQVKEHITDLQPSFFELTFAMALAYFKHMKCDIVMLETGMGGRLDASNVVTPELSIITSIGLDHQQYLGDTIELIAAEKAGIIKPKVPVVIGQLPEEAEQVIAAKAQEQTSPLFKSSETLSSLQKDQGIYFDTQDITPIVQPLPGRHQLENLATVCQAFKILAPSWHMPVSALTNGVKNLQHNFPILGRWQVLHTSPKLVADVGHNADGIAAIKEQLRCEDFETLHLIFGMVNDKDHDALALLPQNAHYYLCEANIPRALPIKDLETLFNEKGFPSSNGYSSVQNATNAALSKAGPNDLILAMGSFFIVGEVLEAFENGALTFAT